MKIKLYQIAPEKDDKNLMFMGYKFTVLHGGINADSYEIVFDGPCSTGILTIGLESGLGTPSGGQFDWGGRLLKSNGGAQRFPQHGRKSCEECKGKRKLDCKTYRSSKDESRT